jgi:hypothetical protein
MMDPPSSIHFDILKYKHNLFQKIDRDFNLKALPYPLRDSVVTTSLAVIVMYFGRSSSRNSNASSHNR